MSRLADTHHASRRHNAWGKLGRILLLIIDEVGYIPFEAVAANLFVPLASTATYEPAWSSPATSSCGCGEVFGDGIVAATMIDRLVHRAEVISLKGRQLPTQGPRPRPRAHGHQG